MENLEEIQRLKKSVENITDMICDKTEDITTIINRIEEVKKSLVNYINKMLEGYEEDKYNVDKILDPINEIVEIISTIDMYFDQYDEKDANELSKTKRDLIKEVLSSLKKVKDIEKRESIIYRYVDEDDLIFFKDEIISIQQEYLKKYAEHKDALFLVNAEYLMYKYNGIWEEKDIISQLFDVIDNYGTDFKDRNITTTFQKFLILFYSELSEKNMQQFIQTIPDFPEELGIALKIKTDKNYIINKKEKYSDKKIGIDPKINIGIEIETNSKLPHYFIKNIILEIIKSHNDIRKKWRAYVDVSVGHNQGTEFVSPIFHDTTSELSEVGAILKTINELGYYTEKKHMLFNTAGQINIGIDYLDSKEAIVNFLEIYGNVEELLYHIATPNGELLRGFDVEPYATSKFAPVSAKLSKMVVTDEMTRRDVIELATEILGFKKGSISLRDFNRFEFRMFNGTVSFEDWINNIRLCGKMIQISKELADIELNDARTPEEEYKLELKEKLKTENMPLEDKLEVFLDLMFDDEAEKQIYRQRFLDLQETLIKTTGKKEYDRGPREVYGQLFDKVELKRQKRLDKPTNNENIFDDYFGVSDFRKTYNANIEDIITHNAENALIKKLSGPMQVDNVSFNESSYKEADFEW